MPRNLPQIVIDNNGRPTEYLFNSVEQALSKLDEFIELYKAVEVEDHMYENEKRKTKITCFNFFPHRDTKINQTELSSGHKKTS